MIVVTATILAKAGKEKELEEAFKTLFPHVQNEDGTLIYVLHRASDKPGKFFFYEKYKDKEALKSHSTSNHFKKSFAAIQELVEGPPVIELFEEIESIKR